MRHVGVRRHLPVHHLVAGHPQRVQQHRRAGPGGLGQPQQQGALALPGAGADVHQLPRAEPAGQHPVQVGEPGRDRQQPPAGGQVVVPAEAAGQHDADRLRPVGRGVPVGHLRQTAGERLQHLLGRPGRTGRVPHQLGGDAGHLPPHAGVPHLGGGVLPVGGGRGEVVQLRKERGRVRPQVVHPAAVPEEQEHRLGVHRPAVLPQVYGRLAHQPGRVVGEVVRGHDGEGVVDHVRVAEDGAGEHPFRFGGGDGRGHAAPPFLVGGPYSAGSRSSTVLYLRAAGG